MNDEASGAKVGSSALLGQLRHEADCFAGLQSAGRLVALLNGAADEIEQLRTALSGLLDIEDSRIRTGAFKPNAEAQRRISAARELLPPNASAQGPDCREVKPNE